jgi:hypothetical protein
MKLLDNLFDEDEVIDNPTFYWNIRGTEEDMPNFLLKAFGFEMEWYRDDPGRAAFATHESSVELAFFILDTVRNAYGANPGGEEKKG